MSIERLLKKSLFADEVLMVDKQSKKKIVEKVRKIQHNIFRFQLSSF